MLLFLLFIRADYSHSSYKSKRVTKRMRMKKKRAKKTKMKGRTKRKTTRSLRSSTNG